MKITLINRVVIIIMVMICLPLSISVNANPFIENQQTTSLIYGDDNESKITQLREHYQFWNDSYRSLNINAQQNILEQLKPYPLYPYAQIEFLQNNITTIPTNSVIQFMEENRDSPLTAPFISTFLGELTRREDWGSIINLAIDFYGDDIAINRSNMVAQCYYQYALYQQRLKEPNPQLEPIWATVKKWWLTGKELPSVCDPLLDAWSQNGQKTNNLMLLRIELAVQQNSLNLARHITSQLPDDYKTIKTALLALFDDPRTLADFSKTVATTPFTKQIILASFPRLVRKDGSAAEQLLPILIQKQNLTSSEQIKLQQSLADSFFSNSVTDKQKTWRDKFINQYGNSALIEKRIRLAINENEDIAYWLTKLPTQDQQKDEWQYWQAEMLLKSGKKTEAESILKTLASQRGFYGMVSAQKLNQPYQITEELQALPLQQNAYKNLPVIRRITELRHFGRVVESNREWRYFLTNYADKSDYLALAQYTYQLGWGDLAIQATIAGKLWNNWRERLPIMYQDLYQAALINKVIPLSYALAITRQESALDPTVQSPVGAVGLMQLMPATAQDIATKLNLTNSNISQQLLNPYTNIKLGTYYLNMLYTQNDNNRILASAAYNAGPNRVKQWLNASGGNLDAVAFIESVPFNETRNYIKNVLVYNAIYQYFLDEIDVKKANKSDKKGLIVPIEILTQNERDRKY